MNLVEEMGRRDLWRRIQKESPPLADFLKEIKAEFGKVELTKYLVKKRKLL